MARNLEIPADEIKSGTTMAVLAYFVFFIPLLAEEGKNNRFAQFHVEQAIVMLIAQAVAGTLAAVTCGVGGILVIPLLVFHVIGILNAAQGKVAPVPLIGRYGEKFNLVKEKPNP